MVDTGPYARVLHPGYVGHLLMFAAIPLGLGSPWPFISACLAGILLVLGTGLEDRTLQGELEGYRDYARHVRFKLLPGIW